ncbi:MAG: DNA polymerase III subunit gamma/tau [Thermoanaerobaculia bacterium]
MAYQVLARKWRPQDFASLIGQQAVVTALSNALREGRIAQAYLFSGIRGVGKTTAARVFAKALNCERGTANGPCNECPTCLEITKGADMDVLEIDAATYSKVEQVRELAESLKYGPARDRYKVVVLDEVHRLSRQAFDALLKIVEEPPPRLVFIFATTEIEAVPATILSRCQEFHFRRVSNVEAVAHLRHICKAEKIEASDAALALLARAGEGSVRDSVALLDQLATFGNGVVDEQEAIRLLGGIDLALFQKVLVAILAGDALGVSLVAQEVEENGWDPRTVHGHFLAFCRDALHLALGESAETVALPAEERKALTEIAKGCGYENLLRLLHHLLGSESAIRRSEAGALALEIAWLRAAELPRLVAIERYLAGATGAPGGGSTKGNAPRPLAPDIGSPKPAAKGPRPTALAAAPLANAPSATRLAAPSSAANVPNVPNPPNPPITPIAPVVPVAAQPPSVAAPVAEAGPKGVVPAVTAFLEQLVLRRPTLAALFEDPETLSFDDAERILVVRPISDFAAASLNRNRELITSAAIATFGDGVQIRFAPPDSGRATARGSAGAPAAAAPAPAEERKSKVADHPRVQAVLEIFGGEVARVDAPTSPEEAPEEDLSATEDPFR